MSDINARLDALMERAGVENKESPIPVKMGTKRNVVAGGNQWLGQRFPVSLYGPSWLWMLRSENVEAIVQFMEDNFDNISWEK